MTDDQLELVNAYLDGEATADERALVESDSELLTEVERMRLVRNALSDVEQPSATSRESAIAAALAAFDELPAPVGGHAATPPPIDATAPTNIVPFERRRRMRRLQGLSAAAAAIVIVAGGIAITRPDDDGGSTADVQRESSPLLEAPAAQQTSDSMVAMEAISTTAAPMMAVVPTTSGHEAAEEAESGVATAGALTTEPAAADMVIPGPTPAPVDILATLVVLRDEDDLADFAATMKDAPLAADEAEPQCDDGTLKADASYRDADGREQPIVVVMIVEDAEQLGALSLDDCEIVLEAE